MVELNIPHFCCNGDTSPLFAEDTLYVNCRDVEAQTDVQNVRLNVEIVARAGVPPPQE